ncbi:MAG: AEC family transporter, partial [Herbaspirillum sp.]
MHIAAILFPDFSLILLGVVLYHATNWGAPFWSGLEKIVYYVLFPALLFLATARTPLDISVNGVLVGLALATTAVGIALGWLAKPLFHDSGNVFSSGVQTA